MDGTVFIRPALQEDLGRIMDIFALAREFMAASGNPGQWVGGYPYRELMSEMIGQGCCYVCESPEGRIAATFCLVPGPDPTYREIYDGAWLDDAPYHVIHRLASDGSIKGIGRICIDWCLARTPSLRLDTHADNRIMQSLAADCGFVVCGTIYTDSGSPRIAYQHLPGNPSSRLGKSR